MPTQSSDRRPERSQASFYSTAPIILADRPCSFDLPIHRRTATHHGRSLRTLGHAAEYLTASRALLTDEADLSADREAIHLLMRLSREVFAEYAITTQQRHPVTDWMMNQAVRIYGAA